MYILHPPQFAHREERETAREIEIIVILDELVRELMCGATWILFRSTLSALKDGDSAKSMEGECYSTGTGKRNNTIIRTCR